MLTHLGLRYPDRLTAILATTILTLALPTHAQDITGNGFTVSLAKAPDSKDSAKPATLGVQKNDAGQSEFGKRSVATVLTGTGSCA
jgi:hypothetical protein